MLEHVPAHEGRPGRSRCSCRSARWTTPLTSAASASAVSIRARSSPVQDVAVYSGPDSTPIKARVNQVLKFEGLERKQADRGRRRATSSLINGIEDIGIGVTLTDIDNPVPLPMLQCRRADADHELLRQQLAAGRARRQVRHQPPDPRPPRPRTAEQRGDEGRGNRRRRRVRGLRPRRTAPDHPAGEHAPRRLRAGGEQAARGLPRGRRRDATSRSSWSPPTSRTSTRAR